MCVCVLEDERIQGIDIIQMMSSVKFHVYLKTEKMAIVITSWIRMSLLSFPPQCTCGCIPVHACICVYVCGGGGALKTGRHCTAETEQPDKECQRK